MSSRSGAKIEVSLVNEQSRHAVDEVQLIEAVTAVLSDSPFTSAKISIAVVDDATIREINRQYLNHDWTTDVISFPLENAAGHLEGEVIISADTAASVAVELGNSAVAEQLLYAIHGTLHLAGYGDKSPAEIEQIRRAEARYLREFGVEPVRDIETGASTP